MTNLAQQPASHVALIYARVSEGQGSINDQIQELTQWATDEGWTIGRTIIDGDRSASRYATREREGFKELVQAIREPNRPESILLTWEPSRLSRISEQIHQLTDLMAKHQLLWGYDQSVYDLRKTRDKAKVRHDGVDSEKESDQTSDRVSRHMRNAAAKGRPHGQPPFGYRRVFDQETGLPVQVVDVDQAALVVEAAERFLNGESTRAIAKDFQTRGIATPTAKSSKRGWAAHMVVRMLTNPAINGKRTHKGKVVAEGQWPAIVDEVTFARLQARFSDPSRKVVRQRESANLLTGVARCGVCGGPMGFAAKVYQDGTKDRQVYTCRYGNHVARYQKPLEEMVLAWVVEYANREGVQLDDPSPSIISAREEIDALKQQLAEAVHAVEHEGMSIQAYTALTNMLEGKIRKLERSMKVANVPTVAYGLMESDDPAAYLEALNAEQVREILRCMVQVIVHPVKVRGSHRFEQETIEINRV